MGRFTRRIWVSEWRSGQVSMYDPQVYAAMYVNNKDIVWISDFGANTMLRFDPKAERFTVHKSNSRNVRVRQILGRLGEVWPPESGADKLVVMGE